MISNITGVPYDKVRIGLPVRLEFLRVDDAYFPLGRGAFGAWPLRFASAPGPSASLRGSGAPRCARPWLGEAEPWPALRAGVLRYAPDGSGSASLHPNGLLRRPW
ncbi:hypothetical protein ACWC1G_32510, partial [Streptomyces sp. NPDC001436]